MRVATAATMLALFSGVSLAKNTQFTIPALNGLQNYSEEEPPVHSNAGGVEFIRVIIKFTPGNGRAAQALAERAGGEIKIDLPKHEAFAVEIPAPALQGLQNNPNIEFIELDATRRLLSTNLNASEVTPWGIGAVEANVASDSQADNRTVCIIDSGYDIRHIDLNGNNVSGTNNSGTGDWSTPGGSHGTHVAGTIAGMTNGSGVVGVLPNGNIYLHIIKVFNADGWGYSSGLISAMDKCVDAGSNIVSMSLGGSRRVQTEKRAFNSYYNQGVLSISAAGNGGNTAHSYPASYDSVVSVAAVDSGNMHANFSQRTNQVEVSGPGEAVLSSVAISDGQLVQLSVANVDYFANGVVPQIFYNSDIDYAPTDNHGSASGTLGTCSTSGTSYVCGDMTDKICLVERGENQGDNTSSTQNAYPEYRAANACADAGAKSIVIYSNEARPGLQAPFLVDFKSKLSGIPTASVDRATGLELADKAGQTANMSKVGGQDWDYYNGTSMATPHVSAVAALVWSHHTGCSASEVRNALQATAEDIEADGKDDKTGYGLVKAQAAVDYLAGQSCSGGTVDNAPSASFTYSCTDLTCSFTDKSSDDNGISSRSWNFGDGNSGSGETTSHTYSPAGTYSVTLTVTDTSGQTDSSLQDLTVSSGLTGGFELFANGYKVKGRITVDLTWSGATSSNVDVFRNNAIVATTTNSGSYTDKTDERGGGTYTYKLCNEGTLECSADVNVSF